MDVEQIILTYVQIMEFPIFVHTLVMIASVGNHQEPGKNNI